MADVSRLGLVALCALTAVTAARAQTKPESRRPAGHSRTINVATQQFTGEKVRGPATLTLTNVNVLRYDVRVGTSVTYASGPDLRLPFIPPIPSPPGSEPIRLALSPTGEATKGPATLRNFLLQKLDELNTIERERYEQVQGPVLEAVQKTDAARDAIDALVTASDAILQFGDGPQRLIDAVDTLLGKIKDAKEAPWPYDTVEGLIARLTVLRNNLSALPAAPAGPDVITYDQIVARIPVLQSLLEAVNYESTAAVEFRETRSRLDQWAAILSSLKVSGTSAFEMEVPVGCSFAFSGDKESKVEMVKHDRLAAPGTGDSRQEVLIVVCSSPLSVSGGFGFSNIDESVPALIQSKKTGADPPEVVSTFGYSSRSAFRPLPVLLLNTRVWEPSDVFALNLSAGAVVDVATGQAGTDIEFVLGPTAGFNRTFFLTLGLHVGRVAKLAGDFKEGDEVPSGVSAPPVEKTWKGGLAVLATWKIH